MATDDTTTANMCSGWSIGSGLPSREEICVASFCTPS